MGMLDRWGDTLVLFRRAQEVARTQDLALSGHGGAELGLLSPWASKRNLTTISAADWHGATGGLAPLTVADAMRVPAVKKGRAILHAVLTSAPLVAIRNVDGVDTVLTGKDAPTWLYRSDTGISPEARMAGMIDDFLFHEATLLAVMRGKAPADGARGAILDAVHVPYEWWDVDPDDGTLLVDGKPADADKYLWLPGPSAGLLVEARAELRQWLDISRNIAIRLASPTPTLIVEDSDTGSLEDPEVKAAIEAINEARRSADGATIYVPAGLKVTPVTANDDKALFVEARNALRIDLANHMNLPVALLDGSPATASLTYSTGEGKRSEFDDLSVDYWTTPLEAGLSQDIVVPRSTRIRFDFGGRYAPTNAPTGVPVQD